MAKYKLKKRTKTPKDEMQKRIQRKKITKVVLLSLAVVMVIGCSYMGFKVFKQVEGFSREKLISHESSIIVAADGTEYYTYGSGGARKNVAYEDIPQVMIDAVVAAEDSRFFIHNGFDLPRIVKALMGNIVAGGITGGGSTITQQMIKKSYYPKEEQTIERKIGEVILSIQASSAVTKEEVLELYLNKIYFGYGNKAIGIYAASKYYFDKSVQELTLPEAALLAGTLNSPNSFDPFRNLTKAQNRRDTVLMLMRDHGYISSEEYETTKKIPVENTLKRNPISSSGRYQAYADKVTREIQEYTDYNPETTAMRIYTYMDVGLQEKLDDISNGTSFKYPNEYLQVGASVQEATTGRIIGIIGGGQDYTPMGTTYAYAASKELASKDKNFKYGQRNQPGSSMKPIISYAAAFEFLDWSTAHTVHDIPLDGEYSPKNWDNKFHGDVSLSSALSSSWNLAAIDTYNQVRSKIKPSGVKEYLEGLGFDMYGEKTDLPSGYAIGGWDLGVTPEEQAGAYAAIANGGTYIKPHTIQKIEILSTGEVIEFDEDIQKEKSRALSEESAFMIRQVMTDYVKAGTGSYGRFNTGHQIGAKTGTSNHSNEVSNVKLRGKNKDLWLSAFSPDYSWSVWTGYGIEGQRKSLYPTGLPNAEIAKMISSYLHKDGLKNSYPDQPSGVVQASLVTGLYPYVAPGSSVPSDRVASGWFKKGNTPSGTVGGSSLNSLTSFTAALRENKIDVAFAPYDPLSMTENAVPTKTYTANGKSYTLPYLGDPKQILGKVVYVVDVVDAQGNVVHTEKLSTDKATLNYTVPSGAYTISGYYAFETGSSTSNKVNIPLTVEAPVVPASVKLETATTNQISLNVTVPTGSVVTLTANNVKIITATTSGVYKFEGLTENTQYTITVVEKTKDGKINNLANIQAKTTGQPQAPAQ